jgi:hypothetical protein
MAAPPRGSDTATNEYVRALSSAAKRSWPKLDAVWGSSVYGKLTLVVADGRRAWEITRRGSKLLPYAEITKRNLSVEYHNFSRITWRNGDPAIYVGLGQELPTEQIEAMHSNPKAIPDTFSFATHEAFHLFVQPSWPETDSGSRSNFYPAPSEPRQWRNEIIRTLARAGEGDRRALGHASYWYQKWKGKYPNEAESIRFTDVSEGSAQYSELVGDLFAQGLTFGSPSYNKAMDARIKGIASQTYFDPDHESYALGSVAGGLLDRKGILWRHRVERGETPLAILLDGVTAISASPDRELAAVIQSHITERNERLAPTLGTFLERLKDPSRPKFIVSMRSVAQSVVMTGSYQIADFDGEVMTGFSTQFALASGGKLVATSTVSALQVNETSCGFDGSAIFVYPGDVPVPRPGKRLQITSNDLTIDADYPSMAAPGTHVYCLK